MPRYETICEVCETVHETGRHYAHPFTAKRVKVTDQPSQRATKAAAEINALSTGTLIFNRRVEMVAKTIEGNFPGYDDLLNAVETLSKGNRSPNVLGIARAALIKAGVK